MGFITVKIDDEYDEFVKELTEEQKEKLNKALSAFANIAILTMMHSGPDNLDLALIFLQSLYTTMHKMEMSDEDDSDSDDDQNEEKD